MPNFPAHIADQQPRFAVEIDQDFNRARFQGAEGNPCGISRLQWLEGTDQGWWEQPVVDVVQTEVEEMLFCRTTIEGGRGGEDGRRIGRRSVRLQWRWGEITRWGDGSSKGFCSLFQQKSEVSRSTDPGKPRLANLSKGRRKILELHLSPNS